MPTPTPPPLPFWQQPAFWITMAILPLVYAATIIVLWPSNGYSAELRALVIGAVIVTTLGAIYGFWMAGSHNATPKPDPTSDPVAKDTTTTGVSKT